MKEIEVSPTTGEANWTAANAEAFAHKIAFDFIAQVEQFLHARGMSRAELARSLGVSQGSVSQTLNNPQNLTLKKVGKYCQTLGLKASVVAYDDGDPSNMKGLIGSSVFVKCWEEFDKPRDIWGVIERQQMRSSTGKTLLYMHFQPTEIKVVWTTFTPFASDFHITTCNFGGPGANIYRASYHSISNERNTHA